MDERQWLFRLKLMIKIIFIILTINSLILIGGISHFVSQLPNRAQFNQCFTTTMYQLKICKDSKNYSSLNQINKNLINSILISEDSLFYKHKGFDWISIKNNFEATLKSKKFNRGGSTISQQLVKNIYFNGDKNIYRKLLEAIYTAKIENELSKNEILELYLNIIEMGPKIYGITQAAQFYFKKKPSELTLVESAFIAMLLPNPTKNSSSYRKGQLTEFAYQSIYKIISDLYRYQYITDVEFNTSINELSLFLRSKDKDEDENELGL